MHFLRIKKTINIFLAKYLTLLNFVERVFLNESSLRFGHRKLMCRLHTETRSLTINLIIYGSSL